MRLPGAAIGSVKAEVALVPVVKLVKSFEAEKYSVLSVPLTPAMTSLSGVTVTIVPRGVPNHAIEAPLVRIKAFLELLTQYAKPCVSAQSQVAPTVADETRVVGVAFATTPNKLALDAQI